MIHKFISFGIPNTYRILTGIRILRLLTGNMMLEKKSSSSVEHDLMLCQSRYLKWYLKIHVIADRSICVARVPTPFLYFP